MSPVMYKAVMDSATMLARMSQSELLGDIDEAIEAAETADAMGPFVNPTLWMEGGGNLRKFVRLLVATREFRKAVAEVIE